MTALESLFNSLPSPPDYIYDWEALHRGVLGTLFQRMEATQQNPRWHGEGDVWVHTRMVCEALAALTAFRSLPEKQRRALALAALLHDVGKVPNTRLEDGQWTSPGHSATGMHMARELLWQSFDMCGTSDMLALRETVCLLIRYHMLPLHILEQDEPEKRLMRIAAEGQLVSLFSLELLCLLSEADVRGRIAPDQLECLDLVQLCAQTAEAAGCLKAPVAFIDAHTQHAFFRGRNVYPDQPLYDDTWGCVTILSGLPGTGKDTWVSQHGGGLPVISLDNLRLQMKISPTDRDRQGEIAQAAQAQARVYLRAKQPFIWNATNITSATRQKIAELCENYGASVRIVYLETAWEENLRRNAGRSACVPEHVIGRMLGKLTLPQRWEARQVEWLCM